MVLAVSALNLLQAVSEETVPESTEASVNIQVDMSPANRESELSIKVYLIISFTLFAGS